MSVINTATNSVIDMVNVAPDPNTPAVNLAGTRVYLTKKESSNNVAVIDTNTKLGPTEIGYISKKFPNIFTPTCDIIYKDNKKALLR